MSRLNIAWQKTRRLGCRQWLPNWPTARSRSRDPWATAVTNFGNSFAFDVAFTVGHSLSVAACGKAVSFLTGLGGALFRWPHQRELKAGGVSRTPEHMNCGSGHEYRRFKIFGVGEREDDAHAAARCKTIGRRQQGKHQFHGLHWRDRHHSAREVGVPWQIERLKGRVAELAV